MRLTFALALVLGLGTPACSLNPQPQPPEGFGTTDGDASRNGGGCVQAPGDGGDAGCEDAALDAAPDAEGGPEEGGADAAGE